MSPGSRRTGPTPAPRGGSSRRLRAAASIASALALLAAAALAVSACEQREGERCQRTSDCAEGLICNLGTQQCQTGASDDGGIFGIDAPLDAEVPDAPPDARIDAGIDAPPAL